MDSNRKTVEQSESGRTIIESIQDACSHETMAAPPTEIRMSSNNMEVTLRFAEKPNGDIQESVLRVLVGSYKARVVPSVG